MYPMLCPKGSRISKIKPAYKTIKDATAMTEIRNFRDFVEARLHNEHGIVLPPLLKETRTGSSILHIHNPSGSGIAFAFVVKCGIDEMVYELYGLTDEEIKIAEESVG